MSELTTVFLTRRFDRINPESIDDYIADGGYEALRKALTLSKSAVIDEVKASGLKGRGGAGYPTGLKMQAVAQASGYPKYIICNADEGEPGNFKDRYMMEKDPHQFIEVWSYRPTRPARKRDMYSYAASTTTQSPLWKKPSARQG